MAFFKQAQKFVVRNLPTIMSSLAVGGVFSTAYFASRDTKKALRKINDVVNNADPSANYDCLYCEPVLSKKETITATWKCYIPTIITATMTVGLVASSNSINLKRNAALASVYTMTEAALKRYQDKVVENIGEVANRKIKDEVYADRIREDDVSKHEVVVTGKGNTLCYEETSGRYFYSDIETIRQIRNEINHMLLQEDFVTLNEFYYRLGLRQTKYGDDMGWDSADGLMDFIPSSHLTEEGVPCLVIDTAPKYNFRGCT